MLRYYDTHAHYGLYAFSSNKKYRQFYKNTYQNLVNAREAGVIKFVNVAIDINSNERMLREFEETMREFPEIRFAVGEHPNSVGTENESYLDEEKDYFLERLLKEKAVCAIKTGLDFYRGKENSVRQTERFRRRIRQARKYRLPLVLHVRDAHEKALEILREESEGKMYQGVIHCFTEKPAVAWEYIKLGFCVGIGGKITSPRFDSLRETVKELPLDWIVLETDAPFVPLYGNVYGNGSCDIPKIAEQVAKIKGEILEEVAEQTYQNAEKIFG